MAMGSISLLFPLLRSVPHSTPPHTSLSSTLWRLGDDQWLHCSSTSRAQLFREKFSAHDQLCSEAGKYYAQYHYNPNWKELSHYLYRAGETEALQVARPHIQTVAGNC